MKYTPIFNLGWIVARSTAVAAFAAPSAPLADDMLGAAAQRFDEQPAVGGVVGSPTVMLATTVRGVLMSNDDSPARLQTSDCMVVAGFAARSLGRRKGKRRWKNAVGSGLALLATSVSTAVRMDERDPFDPALPNRRLLFSAPLTMASSPPPASPTASSLRHGS